MNYVMGKVAEETNDWTVLSDRRMFIDVNCTNGIVLICERTDRIQKVLDCLA